MMPWQHDKPWPWDLVVQPEGGSAVGVRLNPGANGQMVGQQSRKVNAVVPTTYSYSELNPYREKPFVFGPLTGGVGESIQSTVTPTRYKYGRRIDMSIGGQRRLGPAFTAETTIAGQEVHDIQPGRHNGTDVLFALVGPRVYRYDPVLGWVLSHTDSHGYQTLQGVQFKSDAGADSFWVTNEAGELWAYDGASWAKATLPAGALARFVEKVGTELHILGGNILHVCTAGDPLLALSWGGPIYIGEYGKSATWARAVADQVFYFKEDGIFTVTTDDIGNVSVNDLFPELRRVTGAHYGRAAAVWKGAIWFQFGETFWKLTGGASPSLEPAGLERLLGLDNRLRRPGVAFAGHGTWFGYLVTEATDLMKLGTWVNTANAGAQYQFNEDWNGSLADWNAKTATAIAVSALIDGNPWLVIGFNDGTIERTRLPAVSPDPADDPACTFVTGDNGEDSYLEWPDHHALAQADSKHWRGFTATGPKLDDANYVGIAYRTDPDAPLTDLGSPLTTSGQRVNTPDTVSGSLLYVRESLHGTRTSTPRVESVVLHEQVRPARELEYQATASVKNHAPRQDGAIDRRTAKQVRAALAACAGSGPATVWMPDGTSQTVDFVDVGEVLVNPNARYGVEWEIPLTFVQWKTNTIRGTWERVAAYTWAELAAFQWNQLPTI